MTTEWSVRWIDRYGGGNTYPLNYPGKTLFAVSFPRCGWIDFVQYETELSGWQWLGDENE